MTQSKTNDYPATIYQYLQQQYPNASASELKEMERDVIAYQEECYAMENSDDY